MTSFFGVVLWSIAIHVVQATHGLTNKMSFSVLTYPFFFLVKDLNPCPSCCKGGRRNINFRISVGSNLNHYRSAPDFPSQVRAAMQMLHAYHIIPCITFTFSFRFTFHIYTFILHTQTTRSICIYIYIPSVDPHNTCTLDPSQMPVQWSFLSHQHHIPLFISPQTWRFPKMGVPPNHHKSSILVDWDFPW